MKRLISPSEKTKRDILAFVKATSLRKAAKLFDLSEVTVASLAAGLDCTPDTERHAVEMLGSAMAKLPFDDQEAILKDLFDQRRAEMTSVQSSVVRRPGKAKP